MKAKLIIALVVVVFTGGLAYWLGYRQGTVACSTRFAQYYHDDGQDRWRRNGYYQARICLGALTNLYAGNQPQATALLEEHLSEGISRLVSSWSNPQGGQFDFHQILLLQEARDHRLQHPWTNDDPERVERLEKAFKMLDAPDQVKRLEDLRKPLN